MSAARWTLLLFSAGAAHALTLNAVSQRLDAQDAQTLTLEFDLPPPAPHHFRLHAPEREVFDFDASTPAAMRQSLRFADSPLLALQWLSDGDRSRLIASLRADATLEHHLVERVLTLRVLPGPETQRISLDLQNIELRRLLTLLASVGRIDIVADESVGGTMSLKLARTTWRDALELVLQEKGLQQRRYGSALMVATAAQWSTRDKATQEAARQHAAMAPVHLRRFVLRHRPAEEVKTLIAAKTEKQGGLLSERGSVLADTRTNALLVRDTDAVIDEIADLVAGTDVALRQVLIEARIVEVNASFSRELGARLDFARYPGIQSSLDATAGGPAAHTVDLPASVAFGSIATLLRPGLGTRIGLELQAMQARGEGRVVSHPRLLISDRNEALIEEGSTIPYTVATERNTYTTSFRKAVLSLRVKPHISPANLIQLDIDISKDTPDFNRRVEGGVVLDTRHLTSQVQIDNGGTVVIGGILVEENSQRAREIPWLADLPVLGALFRNRQARRQSRELLVFITPQIVEAGQNLRDGAP
ncbi:type IV pilus secretin PilQ [Paludibacterium yongneupense]|uniref:type IV pilus secretin PilQ n=1 Tax=Paludibacterium yongneupense TaxID=400061 RepID=UPI000400846A|nr:type IV pilus secretin PilQ [Paludibacterium yongneupense]